MRIPRTVLTAMFLAVLGLGLPACGGDEGGDNGGAAASFPGTADGAKALLTQFLDTSANHAALSAALRPTAADYAAAYVGEAAGKLETAYGAAWDAGKFVVKPNAGQTELLLWAATSEDLKNGSGDAGKFPGGYKSVVQHLQPGVTFYRFKFVKPGETLGMAFDGLVHVNGRWTIIPKPWRVLR